MIGAKLYVRMSKTAVEQKLYVLQFLKSLPLKLADLPYLVNYKWYHVTEMSDTESLNNYTLLYL
jgi:hypothetical protein